MSDINMECKADLVGLLANVFLYQENLESFASKVKRFDIDALKAYYGLALYHKQHQQQTDAPVGLKKVLEPRTFFVHLNDVQRMPVADNQLCKYLNDAFEVMVSITRCLDKNDGVAFYAEYLSFLESALQTERTDIISVYFQILHRLDHAFDTEIPVAILKAIIEAVHGPFSGNAKLLNEALLLIESNIQKRHTTKSTAATGQILTFIWHNLCLRQGPIQQCDVCYTIVAQLIKVFLDECHLNETFSMDFLSNKLWHFIRDAIESKELLRRKQANYILQHILDSKQSAVMMKSSGGSGDGLANGNADGELNNNTQQLNTQQQHQQQQQEPSTDLVQIWKNFFTVLDSLMEIQCHLVISCLEQYLDVIVKHLPTFWSSILFVLVLKHHNNIVIHYGITFVLRHQISLQHDDILMSSFYGALNNTYLHSEAKIDEQQLAEYFTRTDMNRTLNIMKFIDWHAVPLWTIFKSIDIYVQLNHGQGFQTALLLEFLKCSMPILKSLPQTQEMAVSILRNVGIGQLSLSQTLVLYHLIGRQEILDDFKQPLDVNNFEMLLQMDGISLESKIEYFEHAIPNVHEQSKFLVDFYDNKRAIATQYPHYEFLLMNALYAEKSFCSALLVTAPSIYNLMKPNGSHYTLDGLNFATSLLKFIVSKFMGDNTEYFAFEGINKIVSNVFEVLRQQLYAERKDPRKEEQIRDHMTVINMKLTKCTRLYHINMAVLGPLTNAVLLEEDSVDLVRFSCLQIRLEMRKFYNENLKNSVFPLRSTDPLRSTRRR